MDRQPALRLSKKDKTIALEVDGAQPELTQDARGHFTLVLTVGGHRVEVGLSSTSLQTLGLQCIALRPALAPQIKVSGTEVAYRLQLGWIRELDDRSTQTLIRELQSHTLIDALWYMKDADLMRQFIHNLSRRAAEMLMEDIERRWWGRDPDTASEDLRRAGRSAVLEIIGIARRLMDEGQLPDYFGERK